MDLIELCSMANIKKITNSHTFLAYSINLSFSIESVRTKADKDYETTESVKEK